MANIVVNATASLTANGRTTATGTITWTAPDLPTDVTAWDAITISGTWTWDGRGSITYVKINGTNTSNGVAFSIPLSASQTSPLSISCVGNKNATGSSFTWSNLVLTYEYTPPTKPMYLKQNSAWTEVKGVYKKENGNWVLQTDLESVFDTQTNYIKG